MVKAGLTIPVTKQVVIQPLLAYWFPLSGDAKKRISGNSFNPSGYLKSLWQGGVIVAHNFVEGFPVSSISANESTPR